MLSYRTVTGTSQQDTSSRNAGCSGVTRGLLIAVATGWRRPSEHQVAATPRRNVGCSCKHSALVSRTQNIDQFRLWAQCEQVSLTSSPRMRRARFRKPLVLALAPHRPVGRLLRNPAALPLSPAQMASRSFSYLRDRARRFEKALWNCDQFPRPDRSQCMKAQTFQPGASEEPPRQAVDTGLPFGPAASIADPLGSRTTKAIARPRVGGALLPSGSAPEPAPNPAATATP
jgi:hypothetical protein